MEKYAHPLRDVAHSAEIRSHLIENWNRANIPGAFASQQGLSVCMGASWGAQQSHCWRSTRLHTTKSQIFNTCRARNPSKQINCIWQAIVKHQVCAAKHSVSVHTSALATRVNAVADSLIARVIAVAVFAKHKRRPCWP